MVYSNSTKIAEAFRDGRPARGNNTACDGDVVKLHGNRIAWRDELGQIWVTLAGWNTATTRDRVGSICCVVCSSAVGISSNWNRRTQRQDVMMRFRDKPPREVGEYEHVAIGPGPLGTLAVAHERGKLAQATAYLTGIAAAG